MCAEGRDGAVRDPAGGGGFGVFLRGVGLSPGFDEGAADDAGADEGDLGYYFVRLWGGLLVDFWGISWEVAEEVVITIVGTVG